MMKISNSVSQVVIVIIVCATILTGLWIWKQNSIVLTSSRAGNLAPLVQNSAVVAIKVNPGAIASVMKQKTDLLNATVEILRHSKVKGDVYLDRYAALLNTLAFELKEIETYECPRDFVEAYTQYASAISALSTEISLHRKFSDQYQNDLEARVRRFIHLSHDPISKHDFTRDELDSIMWIESWNSDAGKYWKKVEAIATHYGVHVVWEKGKILKYEVGGSLEQKQS